MQRRLLAVLLATACARPVTVAAPSAAPPAPPPATARAPAAGGEGWDEQARRVVAERRRILQDCWETELRRVEDEAVAGAYLDGGEVPTLGGSLVLVLPVGPAGDVAEPRIEQDQLANERVVACLLSEARLVRFPPPPDGETVELRVPFAFKVSGPRGR